jgi:hypothetical protein
MRLFSSLHPDLVPAARRVVVLAASLAIAAAWTASAEASCGDWLNHSGAATQETERNEEQTPEKSGSPAPCRGPQCERAPPTPAPPAPAGFPTSSKDVGWIIGSDAVSQSGLRPSMLAEASLILPDGHPQRIDRPPRCRA